MPDATPRAATDRHVVGLLCRTAERGPEAAQGARELAQLLGARLIGSPGEPGPFDSEHDLRHAHGCLLEAGGQVEDAFDAGNAPILLAGDCSIALATLPVSGAPAPRRARAVA